MRRLLLVAALSLLVAGPASAQDARKGDLFGGYSMLRSDGETVHGFEASLGYQAWGSLGLVADVSRHSKTISGADFVTEAYLAGPRLVFGKGSLRPSVHALAGIARSGGSIKVFDVSISERATDMAAALGGAVDLGADRRFSARLKADYLLVKGESETTHDPRFSAGVVYRF
jgi:hypothetical protein